MKRILIAIVFFAGTAAAQRYYYPERQRGGPPRAEVFERTQGDLSRAAQHSYDRRRIEHAQHEIAEFQRKLSYGRFSNHDLDRAIGATDDVVRRARVGAADRDVLFRDLEGMRAFRAYAR